MQIRSLHSVVILVQFLLVSVAVAEIPIEAYRVKLGPGNHDLEEQIDAIPWTDRPGFNFKMKDASKVKFSGRDLRLAEIHFQEKGIYGANFDNCRLDGSTLAETWFLNCSFRNASLRFCEMDRLSEAPAFFNDFTGADISGSSIRGLPGVTLEQTRNYREKRLVSTHLSAILSGQSFRNFDLYNVTFFFPVDGSDFTDARMRRMMIFDNFSKEQVYSTATYKSKELSTLLFASLRGATNRGRFAEWDFSGCNLAYFLNCDLTDAKFADSFFLKTKGMQVHETEMNRDLPVWVYYRMVKVSEIGFDNCLLSESQLRQTVNWKRKDLRGMHLKNMALDGWDFSGMDMRWADLSGASLEGTNFTGTDIKGIRLEKCRGLTVAQLLRSPTHTSHTRENIVNAYFRVDFVDRTETEKEIQETNRRTYPKD